MKFNELWLREWINPPISTKELANQMTLIGLEVRSIEPVACFFNGVVVGKIIECIKHPNSENLLIAKVDIGKNNLLDIVCKTLTCKINSNVAVATVGAILQGGLNVKSLKFRGKVSNGILCSYFELGISNYSNTTEIIELPKDAPIGCDIREYLKLNDNIFNVNIAHNRFDHLSILGISRDISIINRLQIKIPKISSIIPIISDNLQIIIDKPEMCPSYLNRIIKRINVDASTPLWMKEKLFRCEIFSINVVLDIINYVMLELGQPIEIMDLNDVHNEINIRFSYKNESYMTIDNKEIFLEPNTLIIADKNKILTIAGVSRGINSSTKDIILESAFFNFSYDSEKMNHFVLNSKELCFHFHKRGIDLNMQQYAIEYATDLLVKICGGDPGPINKVVHKEFLLKHSYIHLHHEKLNKIIGHSFTENEVDDILLRLGCNLIKLSDSWKILPPSWRFDIKIEEDIIEEIVKIYGYNKISDTRTYDFLQKFNFYNESIIPLSRAKDILVDRGYNEVITYSFVNPKIQKILHPKQKFLLLPNPISEDMSSMRLSLWTGLLNSVIYNKNHQHNRIRLFESGLCFIPNEQAYLGVQQNLMLAGVITGCRFNEHWDLPNEISDFYDIKGDLYAILSLTNKLNEIEFKTYDHSALHPGQSAAIYLNKEIIGFIGAINPKLEEELNLNSNTLVFEINWKKISARNVMKASMLSRFPSNRRDISIIVPENIPSSDIINICKKSNQNQLISVKIFDVYKGKDIEKGFKSLSISLVLQDETHTLEESEIKETVLKCVKILENQFNASLRKKK